MLNNELRRVVSFQEGEEAMKKYGLDFFFETSAKDGKNIDYVIKSEDSV